MRCALEISLGKKGKEAKQAQQPQLAPGPCRVSPGEFLCTQLDCHWTWAARRKDMPLKEQLFAAEAIPGCPNHEDCLLTALQQLGQKVFPWMGVWGAHLCIHTSLTSCRLNIKVTTSESPLLYKITPPFLDSKHNPSLRFPLLCFISTWHIIFSFKCIFFLHIPLTNTHCTC